MKVLLSIVFITFISFILMIACEKEEGIGGTSTITGKVKVREYNGNFTFMIGEYYAGDQDVYIIYGNDSVYSDKFTTSYDGTYRFEYLREGTYKVFAYSLDSAAYPLDRKMEVMKELQLPRKIRLCWWMTLLYSINQFSNHAFRKEQISSGSRSAVSQPISLEEMDKVSLMNRVDQKFILSFTDLCQIIPQLEAEYRILTICDQNVFTYKTDYYDTPGLNMFTDHHNGKLNRFKIRHREYVESNLEFLEIKFKNNKGKTLKKRVESPHFTANRLNSSSKNLLLTIRRHWI